MYSILPSLQTKQKKIHSRTFTCDRTSWISDGLEGNKWITITVMASLWKLVPAQVIHSLIDNKSLQAPNKCLHHLKGPQKKSQGVEISHGFLRLFLFFFPSVFLSVENEKTENACTKSISEGTWHLPFLALVKASTSLVLQPCCG